MYDDIHNERVADDSTIGQSVFVGFVNSPLTFHYYNAEGKLSTGTLNIVNGEATPVNNQTTPPAETEKRTEPETPTDTEKLTEPETPTDTEKPTEPKHQRILKNQQSPKHQQIPRHQRTRKQQLMLNQQQRLRQLLPMKNRLLQRMAIKFLQR